MAGILFQLLERLPAAERPLVVFVSAYSERALEAFDVEAVDYLVKPLSPQRLREAVSRVRMWLAGRAAPAPVRPTAAGACPLHTIAPSWSAWSASE